MTLRTLVWAAALVGSAHAAAQPAPEQPPAENPPHQRAEQAMQGGGMTEERQLDDASARAHFRVGQSLYDAGRFDEAAREFEEAYRLSNRAELLFNAYVAFRDASDAEGAVRTLSGYLEHATDVPDRLNLEARLRSLRTALEQHQAAAERANEVVPPSPPPQPRPGEVWPWIVMSIGGAAAITGLITGIVANGMVNAIVAECPSSSDGFICSPRFELGPARDQANTMAVTTDLLLIGGGAIALTGLILGLIFGLDQGAPATASASCGPTGCTAIVQGRF